MWFIPKQHTIEIKRLRVADTPLQKDSKGFGIYHILLCTKQYLRLYLYYIKSMLRKKDSLK